jgi:hypothetical protein
MCVALFYAVMALVVLLAIAGYALYIVASNTAKIYFELCRVNEKINTQIAAIVHGLTDYDLQRVASEVQDEQVRQRERSQLVDVDTVIPIYV